MRRVLVGGLKLKRVIIAASTKTVYSSGSDVYRLTESPVCAGSTKLDPHSIPVPSNDDLLKTYIQDMRKFTADPIAASLRNAEGTSAYFWFDDELRKYFLIIEHSDGSCDATYWGDTDDFEEHNEIPLTAPKLFKLINEKVPNWIRSTFYGQSAIFEEYPGFYS